MKRTAFPALLIACSIALTGCSGGNSGSESSSAVTTESTSGTTATTTDTTNAPETTTAPETTVPTVEVTVPTAESTEPAAETAQAEVPQVAELIGMTIGDIETMYNTELAPSEFGYSGSHTFDCIGAELAFNPLAVTLAEDYRDSVVTGLFINTACPILDGITGNMSYNELNAIVGDIDPPETNEMDYSVVTMFMYKGYKFIVSWSDYVDLDTPCYSITVTAE
ncbi:MAG: hypothetical protein MR291_08220 [Oscillospiraceae bacterium]|nr:hypothetical protein [Oscillospiraceae bacterium]